MIFWLVFQNPVTFIKLILLVLTFIVLKGSPFLFISHGFITTFKVLYEESIETVDR